MQVPIQPAAEMQRCLVAIFLAAALMLGASAYAEDAPGLQPGNYEVTIRLELRHVEMAAPKVATICVTETGTGGLIVLSENNPLARCPASNVRRNGDTLTFDIVCPGGNQAVGSARYTVAPQHFTGVIAMKMGGKNMTMTEYQVGRRIGNCVAGSPRS
jgi:hypothetical protein